MEDFEVLVVGGGPAGSAAAIRCALAGARVVLLERSEFPRHRPGETLHPGVEPLLRQLGVWEAVEACGFVRHAGLQVHFNRQTRFEAYGSDARGPWLGLQAWRADFDQILLGRARELGVHIRQPCAVGSAVVHKNRVIGVESDWGEILAPFTIDTTGTRRWLVDELRLPVHTASPRLIARFGYVEGDYVNAHDAPLLKIDDSGWTWVARVRERTFQWTRLLLQPDSDEACRQDAYDFPNDLRALKPMSHTCGADVTWRCASQAAGPGYFLCGDAAAVLDPASSHGVLKAVMSGIYAGHLIGQIRSNITSEEEAAVEYSGWLTRWFRHDADILKRRYSDMGLCLGWRQA